jgi:phage shock protein A
MSLWSRIRMLFRVKTSATLDKMEDPRQVLDYAYSEQQELLRKVRAGLVDVATSKRQLEMELDKLHKGLPRAEDMAREALKNEREDLARLALQRKQTAVAEIGSLETQLEEVAEEENRLAVAEQQLSAKVEEFRTTRHASIARYEAAEAQVKVSEALTGVSGELADLSMALGRAEEKTRRMQARASALGSLMEVGSFTLPNSGGDALERELKELSAAKAVDDELEAMRQELEDPPSTD